MAHISRQSGFSLIELMLTLGIGILLMAAVYAAYDTRRSDAEVTIMVADIDTLIYKANMAYAGTNQFVLGTGSTVPVNAIRLNDSAGGLPDAFIPNAGFTSGFSHYWGGEVALGAASTDGGITRDLLTISLENVPPEVCINLIGQVAPRMYDTRVGGSLVGLFPARTSNSLGRYNIRHEQAAPLCLQEENDIVFRHIKPFDYSAFRSKPATNAFPVLPAGYFDEGAFIQPNFNRVEAAMTAREAAQVAIP